MDYPMKVSFKGFKDISDACEFASLVHENLVNITTDKNGAWYVIYKELKN